MSDDTSNKDRTRRNWLYRVGRVAGKQFQPNAPGREVARRAGGALIRRSLWRFLR